MKALIIIFFIFFLILFLNRDTSKNIERNLYLDNIKEYTIIPSPDYEDIYIYDTYLDEYLPDNFSGNFIIKILNSDLNNSVEFRVTDTNHKPLGDEKLITDSEYYRIPFRVDKKVDDLILQYKTNSSILIIFRIDIQIKY